MLCSSEPLLHNFKSQSHIENKEENGINNKSIKQNFRDYQNFLARSSAGWHPRALPSLPVWSSAPPQSVTPPPIHAMSREHTD
jgi:hypothetical protein